MGGVEKGGGRKTSRMTPLPKRGFGPPSYGTFSTPLARQCSVFPVQKSTTEQTRSSFGGVQKFSGERVLWYVLHPPYVFAPPHITAQGIGCDRAFGGGGGCSCDTLVTHSKLRKEPQRGCKQPVWGRRAWGKHPNSQISFEPGFVAYQSLAQKIKVSFSRFFSFFLQF